MLAFTAALSALVASSFVSAEATPLQLQVEEANFVQSKLVPDLLASFNPTAVMNVSFSGTAAEIGQPLTVAQVKETPSIMIDGGSNATNLAQGTFTVAMVDPATVGSDQSGGQTRHWLVNNVKLTGEGPYGLEFPSEAITAYGGPFPAEGSGPHRYTILLLPQPESFKAPDGLNAPGVAISTMDFPSYITSTGLEAPIAGFYFTVEQGQSSMSIEATSAVAASTLAVSSASSAHSASGTAAAVSSSQRAVGGGSIASATKSAGAAASSAAAAASGGAASRVGGGAAGVVAFVGAAVAAGLML